MLFEIAFIILLLLYPVSVYKAFTLGAGKVEKKPTPRKRKKTQKKGTSELEQKMKAIDDYNPLGV